jgi:hypothetical protein
MLFHLLSIEDLEAARREGEGVFMCADAVSLALLLNLRGHLAPPPAKSTLLFIVSKPQEDPSLHGNVVR